MTVEPNLPGAGRVVARLARVVELSLAEVDLSLSQFRLLVLLFPESAMASKLAEHLAVSPPSVTAVVDGLVVRGLVERRIDGVDRRRVEHALTGDGRRLLQEAEDAVEARLSRSLAYLNRTEASRTAEGLRLWARALDVERSTMPPREVRRRAVTDPSAPRSPDRTRR